MMLTYLRLAVGTLGVHEKLGVWLYRTVRERSLRLNLPNAPISLRVNSQVAARSRIGSNPTLTFSMGFAIDQQKCLQNLNYFYAKLCRHAFQIRIMQILSSCGNQCAVLNGEIFAFQSDAFAKKRWFLPSRNVGKVTRISLALASFLIGVCCLIYAGSDRSRLSDDTMLDVLPSSVIYLSSLKANTPNPIFASLVNRSTEDIIVTSVEPDCGCTTVELSVPHLIPPGSDLKLKFNWTMPPIPTKQERSILIKYMESGESRYGFLVFRGAVGS